MTKEQKRMIIKELELIAGKYNVKIKLKSRDGKKTEAFVWRLTVKGVRAYDWNRLLVLADKAQDLDCKTFFCNVQVKYTYRWYSTFANTRVYPTTEEYANAIAVYLPS